MAVGRSSPGGGVGALAQSNLPASERWSRPGGVGRSLTPPAHSVAILLYLSHKCQTEAHWYPPELQAHTRVDEYLAWQHTAIQLPATNVYLCKVSLPALSCLGRTQDPQSWKELVGPYINSRLLPWADITNLSQLSFP